MSAVGTYEVLEQRSAGDVFSDAPQTVGDSVEQMVAVLGWVGRGAMFLPTWALRAWVGAGLVLLVGAVVLGRGRARIGVIVLTAGALAFPIVSQLTSRGTGWQGRYGLPLAVGIPIVAGWAVDRSGKLPARVATAVAVVVVSLTVVVQVVAHQRYMTRVVLGLPNGLFDSLSSGRWNGPATPSVLLAGCVLTSVAFAVVLLFPLRDPRGGSAGRSGSWLTSRSVKGLILAGGSGSRLRPITHTSAKQLVPVANKPILFYGLEHMVDAGVEEFGIVIGDGPSADEIRAAVGDGSRWGVRVTYIPQDAPLGLGHCVLIARDFLGDDDFIMYLGDNMIQQGVAGFVERFEADRDRVRTPTLDGPVVPPSAQILLCPVPDPQRFGVAAVDAEGHVVRLVEKPVDPPSNLALCGVYLFTPAIHEAVRAIEPSPRGELEITDAIQWLIDQGHRVRHDVLEGWWLDTGKKDPLLESNRRVLEVLEPRCDGKVDEDSVIDGRVVIEEGAELVGLHRAGPGRHRRPHPPGQQLRRAVHRDR